MAANGRRGEIGMRKPHVSSALSGGVEQARSGSGGRARSVQAISGDAEENRGRFGRVGRAVEGRDRAVVGLSICPHGFAKPGHCSECNFD